MLVSVINGREREVPSRQCGLMFCWLRWQMATSAERVSALSVRCRVNHASPTRCDNYAGCACVDSCVNLHCFCGNSMIVSILDISEKTLCSRCCWGPRHTVSRLVWNLRLIVKARFYISCIMSLRDQTDRPVNCSQVKQHLTACTTVSPTRPVPVSMCVYGSQFD